jgi:hypothetical protein
VKVNGDVAGASEPESILIWNGAVPTDQIAVILPSLRPCSSSPSA